jgi:hypothetical protein
VITLSGFHCTWNNIKDKWYACLGNAKLFEWQEREKERDLGSISSSFHEKLLRIQFLKATQRLTTWLSFLRFWYLCTQKLLVESWWNWPLNVISHPFKEILLKTRLAVTSVYVWWNPSEEKGSNTIKWVLS